MRFVLCLIIAMVSFTGAVAQPFLSPAELAYLQDQFLRSITSSIPGSTIIVGTLPPDRLSGPLSSSQITESDPVFIAHVTFAITAADIANWDTAYGWGDHSVAGYLTAETDPVFSASVAGSISGTRTTEWSEAYSWISTNNAATNFFYTGEFDIAGVGMTGRLQFAGGMLTNYVENP